MILFALLLELSAPVLALSPGRSAERTPDALPMLSHYTIDAILDALRRTPGGRRGCGPYRIRRAYFEDSGVAGSLGDCVNAEFGRRVVLAYWRRWCPDALEGCDAQVLVRVHHGGPRGAAKPHTLACWHRTEECLVAAYVSARQAAL